MKKREVIQFFAFIIILFLVFQSCTYLFRGVGPERNNIISMKAERDMDVIFLGGSSILAYWQPLRAWHEYGFRSCDCATNNFPMEAYLYMMKYVRKYDNEPKLWVVEMRSFQAYTNGFSEGGYRLSADALDVLEPIRYEFVHNVVSNRALESNDDVLSYYLDILYYHRNYWKLQLKENWLNLFNYPLDKRTYSNQGWIWRQDGIIELDMPEDYQTSEVAEIDPYVEETLRKLLDYCKDNEQNVLFIASPFYIDKDITMEFNRYREIINEYDYEFLDTNDCYSEMNVDFSRDFHDHAHVNILGAEKFTRFLGDYIIREYEIDDHRSDSDDIVYEWNNYYNTFLGEEKEHLKAYTVQ